MQDQVATVVGRSEQQFKLLAMETAARRRREVCIKRDGAEPSGQLCSLFIPLGETPPLALHWHLGLGNGVFYAHFGCTSYSFDWHTISLITVSRDVTFALVLNEGVVTL